MQLDRSPTVNSSPVRALPGTVILYQSYLYKTPPLDKFFVSWKKRWFVLTRTTDVYNHSTVELEYFETAESKEKKGTIDLSRVESVNPSPRKSDKEHIFSLELVDRHRQMFKAPDTITKAMWAAKLLEVCSKDGQTLHVTVPTQQMCTTQTEGVLVLSTPLKVKVINALTKETVVEIPFEKIRRFGCQVSYQSDVVWFEICQCQTVRGLPPQYVFFTVNSGIEKAYMIVQELKRSIEHAIRAFLIMVDKDKDAVKYSFVNRSHYGCPELTDVGREQALQAGLISVSTDYRGAVSQSQMNRIIRRTSDFNQSTPVPGSVQHSLNDPDRRHTLADLHKGNIVRSPSPQPSPNASAKRTLKDMTHRPPMGLSASSGRKDFDSGIPSESFDPERGSAPCYLHMAAPFGRPPSKEEVMKKVRKNKSFDNGIQSPTAGKQKKMSLSELQNLSIRSGQDSAIGSAADISYDHLSASHGHSQLTYDHLNDSKPSRNRHKDMAYVES